MYDNNSVYIMWSYMIHLITSAGIFYNEHPSERQFYFEKKITFFSLCCCYIVLLTFGK